MSTELLLSAIDAIARSPQVHQFVIGYTSQSAKKRGQQYRRVGFSQLVILADKMNSDDALELEEALDKALKARIGKKAIIKRKWHSEKQNAIYRRSAGGRSKQPEELIHSVYIAWCAPGDS